MTDLIRRLRDWSAVLLVLAGFSAGFVVGQQGQLARAQEATPEPTEQPALIIPEEDHAILYPLWQTYDFIRGGFRSPSGEGVSARAVIEGGIRGMIEQLGDPNSYYISPDEREAFDRRVTAQAVGLGIVVVTDEATGAVVIQSVVEASPAAEAGILAGDIIVGVNGEDVSALSQDAIVERSRGGEGECVLLTIERAGARLDFTIIRAVFTRPVVSSRVIDDVGYVRLDQFSQNARVELDAALEALTSTGVSGLVLDLRGNAGGTSGATVEIASAFIPDGVIFTEDFGRRDRVFEVTGDLAGVDLPLVVLVNGRTQSAAEALAGALQDYDLGTIIGVPTFGKGTVQTVRDLSNGGAFRFTIARVLTPSGDTYHEVGIQPDIAVEDRDGPTDEQLEAALDFLRGDVNDSEG